MIQIYGVKPTRPLSIIYRFSQPARDGKKICDSVNSDRTKAEACLRL